MMEIASSLIMLCGIVLFVYVACKENATTTYDQRGFTEDGRHKNGTMYDDNGYDKNGYNSSGFDANGFDRRGYDKDGYDEDGYDRNGWGRDGYHLSGYDKYGYDREGFHRSGYDKEGYDKWGYNQAGFDRSGFDREGYDQTGFDHRGYSRLGYDKNGFNKDGYNIRGFDRDGFNSDGFNCQGYDRNGYDENGFNHSGYDKSGMTKAEKESGLSMYERLVYPRGRGRRVKAEMVKYDYVSVAFNDYEVLDFLLDDQAPTQLTINPRYSMCDQECELEWWDNKHHYCTRRSSKKYHTHLDCYKYWREDAKQNFLQTNMWYAVDPEYVRWGFVSKCEICRKRDGDDE